VDRLNPPLQGCRVLALGSELTLLAVLRILGSRGASICGLPDADPLALRSRWYRPGPAGLRGTSPATLGEALDCLPEKTVLLPCSDQWLRAVAALPDATLARYPASVPSSRAVEILINKSLLALALERLRLPHPFTRILTGPADLAEVPAATFRSSFLKPVHSQDFFAHFGVKAFSVHSREEATRRLAQCLDAGHPMVLQEYVPGPPAAHYYLEGFMDRGGVTRARFARQRLRMYPPNFGNSTLMVSVPVQEVRDAAQTLDVLLGDLGYRGIFSAEFKWDERAGRMKLLEVNARPWWYVEFAARCGVDVCTMAVRDALGEPVPTLTAYQVGRRCVFPYYDFFAARAELAAGRLSLAAWLRSWLGADQPVFRWNDPLPALGRWAELLARRR
jgi:D-aspartate ligase